MSSAPDMRYPSSSSFSSSSASLSFTKSKKRKWSRDELLKNLSILGPLSAPPAPELPPSPPVSRSSSPAPGTKRKAPVNDSDHNKRPRIGGVVDRSSHHQRPAPMPLASHQSRTSTPATQFNSRSEPAEDGEVREEASTPPSRLLPSAAVLATSVPIRRPRRERPGHSHFDELHRKYYEIGRAFKFSGDARFWSTYPANHKEYRPLPNPPPANSAYHKYGGLIARLELVDALVCFTYSIWSKEYGRRACIPETWQTAQAFLSWCKAKWDTQDTIGDREIAFLGLIYMIEGFIHARKFNYASRLARGDTTALWTNTKELMFTAAREEGSKAAPASLSSSSSHLTPQGLPSPANSVPTTSAHSTPTNGADRAHDHNSAIPSASARPPPQGSPNVQTQALPFPSEFIKDSDFPRGPDGGKATERMMLAASKVMIPVPPHFVNAMQSESQGIEAAQYCLERSQQTLTLPKMVQHFPTTFARMVHSNLAADEEYQPDMEDEEGELFWPGQCATGEGLGWVCLMGKAMINELGKDIGYIGLKGVIPKPKADGQSGAGRGQSSAR